MLMLVGFPEVPNLLWRVNGSCVADAEQALAADRNQRVFHRQLAASAVVAWPLKRGVRCLS
jgi:hypothetical protein